MNFANPWSRIRSSYPTRAIARPSGRRVSAGGSAITYPSGSRVPAGGSAPRPDRHLPRPALWLAAALLLALGAGPVRAQQFTELAPGLPENAFPCMAVGDQDGDGDLDVLVAAAGKRDVPFATIFNNAGGTFTDSGIALTGLSRATAAWGDFDGDGDLDLAMTGLSLAGTATTLVYRNQGGSFVSVPGNFLGVFAGSIAWGDYDGDGDLDLLVTGVTSSTVNGVAATRLYRNDGGTFTSVPHPFPDCYSGAAAWGDYDHDGDLDLVLTGTGGFGGVVGQIWRNDGGVFTDAGANLPGMDLGFAAWGDYDGDGDLDLLYGGNTTAGYVSRVYRNDGGVFTDVNAGLLGVLWASGAWGDYDNDGDLDIMLIGYDAVAAVPRSILYRNDGGVFVDSGATFHPFYLGTLSWLDYDNDGDLDLLIAGNGGGVDLLRLYRNNDLTPNAAPGAPTNLAVTAAGTEYVFSWSAASDDHTPPAGLNYNLRVGTTPGGSQIVSPQALAGGYRRLAALGNAQSGLTARLSQLQPGTTYYWSVQAVDAAFAGSAFAAEGIFTPTVSGVAEAGPAAISVLRAAPNPFSGPTTISYELTADQRIRLEIFDVSGRPVRTLAQEAETAGGHTVRWDGRDDQGQALSGGVYFASLQGEHQAAHQKLVLNR